jgi:hypothetical protein
MFVSSPKYRFEVPSALAAPGALYWRALTTSSNTAFYVLNLTAGGGRNLTLLFSWDVDLLAAIKQREYTALTSLLCVLPAFQTAVTCGPAYVGIKEVWEVEDPGVHGHVLLVDLDGRERMGPMAEVIERPGLSRRLVGRVTHLPQ